MKQIFDLGVRLLLKPGREGGFAHHPKDPGGMTNLGVTKNQWEKYIGHGVTEADMRALTPAMVTPFYKTEYWNEIQGDALPAGVDYAVFDAAVNSGPSRAAKFLQHVLGLKEDGSIGPITLKAADNGYPHHVIRRYSDVRLAFLKGLDTWDTFGVGWANRVDDVEKEALAFAGQEKPPLVA